MSATVLRPNPPAVAGGPDTQDGAPHGHRMMKLRKRNMQNSEAEVAIGQTDRKFLPNFLGRKQLVLQIPKSKPAGQQKKSPSTARSDDRQWSFRRKHGSNSTLSLTSPLARKPVPVDPFWEAKIAQQRWADHNNDGKVAPSIIRDIDWSQVNDEELSDLTRSFDRPIFTKPSPVDSGIDFPLVDSPTYKGKGKGNAVTNVARRVLRLPKRSSQMVLPEEEGPLDEHYKLVQEYELRQDGNDQGYVKALEREEQEAREKEELEEARQRRQREEEDRIHAEKLQEELRRQEEEERRLAEELARALEVECICCGTSKAPGEYHIETPNEACDHAVQTCIECIQTWLSSELESNGFEALKCPECPKKLSFIDVQRCASAETFASYEKFVTRAALAELPNFTWCQNPKCDSGQLNEENGTYMKCMACDYQQCIKHNCEWHKAESCSTYEYRVSGAKARDDERATEAMLNDVSKLCPGKNCGWRIQKTEGCDHMTCRRCRHEFCWQCLAAHAEIKRVGNTAHAKTCSFHSDNLATSWPFNVH